MQKPIRKISLKWNILCFSSHHQHHVGKTTKILEYNRVWQYKSNFICPQLSIAIFVVLLIVYWDMCAAGHKISCLSYKWKNFQIELSETSFHLAILSDNLFIELRMYLQIKHALLNIKIYKNRVVVFKPNRMK